MIIKCLRELGVPRVLACIGCKFVEHAIHHRGVAPYGGDDYVAVDGLGHWVALWPTVSTMSWMGTPLWLMIETAVWRPSWACQWPIPARLVILLNR
jgi:hypothetical protein